MAGRNKNGVDLRSSGTPTPNQGPRQAGSGRAGGGDPPSHEASAGKGARIATGKNRRVQVVRTGSRKLFDRGRKRVFLEWFAATCNVQFAAAKAGVAYQTVFKHRMNDAAFAEAWDRCLGQGYARVEAQQLATDVPAEAFEIDGDWDAPELQKIDPQVALALLREHKKSLGAGASPFRAARKQGRRPRTATNAEIKAALVKRLAVFGMRVAAEEGRMPPPRASDGE